MLVGSVRAFCQLFLFNFVNFHFSLAAPRKLLFPRPYITSTDLRNMGNEIRRIFHNEVIAFCSRNSLFVLLDIQTKLTTMYTDWYVEYFSSLRQMNGGERIFDRQDIGRLINYDFRADIAEMSFTEGGEFNYNLVYLEDPDTLRKLRSGLSFHCFHLYTNKNVMLGRGGEKGVPYFLADFAELHPFFQPEEIMVVGRFDDLYVGFMSRWKNSFGSVNLFSLLFIWRIIMCIDIALVLVVDAETLLDYISGCLVHPCLVVAIEKCTDLKHNLSHSACTVSNCTATW